MKLPKLLTLAAVAALPLIGFARPADQRVQTVTNPDGSTLQVQCFGDENFNYISTADGSMIVEMDANGFWRQAVRDGRGLRPVTADLQILRNEMTDRISQADTRSGNVNKMAARDDDGRTVFPTLATDIRSVVILVEFSDCQFSVPNIRDQYEKLCNQEGYTDYDGVGSARDYYKACSSGKFSPSFDVFGPVKLPNPISYYLKSGESSNVYPGPGRIGVIAEAFVYALKELDPQIDFSQYDYDQDGVIDNVFFFYAGYGQADAPAGKKSCIWPHQQDYNQYLYYYPNLGWEEVYLDGKQFGPYACSNELKGKIPAAQQPYLDGIGAFCHEFTHVIGLPDLYDTQTASGSTGSEVPGYMSILGSGSYNRDSTQPPLFSAYEQWVCRWLEYTDVEVGTHCELQPLSAKNEAVRIRLPKRNSTTVFNPNEYYLVEFRDLNSWDASNPDEGLIVWHIRYKETLWQYNQVNTWGDSRCYIVRNPESYYGWGRGTMTYIYPEMEQALVPMDFTNNAYKAFLTSMTYDTEKGLASFDYNVIDEVPDLPVLLHENPTRAQDDERQVYLKWDPIEGAEAYRVSVWRYNTSNVKLYVNNLNEFQVNAADVPDGIFLIDYLTGAEWKAECHAQVTAIKGLPSATPSNEIIFTPQNLAVSGVNDILGEYDETPVYAIPGGIVAPADAQVFTIDGVRTGRTGLASGIYVVRTAAGTHKVLVK